MEKYHLRKFIENKNDSDISFDIMDLNPKTVEKYSVLHSRDHFCIFLIEKGSFSLHVEDRTYLLKQSMVSLTFPEQIVLVDRVSDDVAGKIILFDEVLFCSDILKSKFKSYNVNLSSKLNAVSQSEEEFALFQQIFRTIETFLRKLTPIKKEQVRFYIKIFLLSIIETAQHTVPVQVRSAGDIYLYSRFLTLLDEHYQTERSVMFYADALSVSTKKLNATIKKYTGNTAIEAIHRRLLKEIKTLLLEAKYSHKEIAFRLGFNSPSAFNKFIKAKLSETPSELQKQLDQMYNR